MTWRKLSAKEAPQSALEVVNRSLIVSLAAPKDSIRTESFMGKDYTVVPVVAMVGDIAVWPVNSEHREFVPASVLYAAPSGWDYRPILPLHPDEGASGANTPALLEAYQFGYLFNTTFGEDKKLRSEAWLDPERAKEVGADAEDVIARCLNGEVIEVSIGARVGVRSLSGTYKGKTFNGIWERVTPDHFAMLPRGSKGACNIEDGCGGNRILSNNPGPGKETQVKPLISKFLSGLFGTTDLKELAGKDGMGNNELDRKIWKALYEVVPAFEGVVEVFQETSTVIYRAGGYASCVIYTRSYTVNGDDVQLVDDAQVVEPVTTYELVKDKEEGLEEAIPHICACQKEEAVPTAKKDLIQQLMAANIPGLTTAHLEGLPDDALTGLAERFKTAPIVAPVTDNAATLASGEAAPANPATPPPANAPVPPPPASPQPKALSAADWLAGAPPEVRNLVDRHRRQEDVNRVQMIDKLAAAQDEFDKDALQTKPTEELEALTRMLGVGGETAVSYIGRGFPADEDKGLAEAPKPYTLAFEKRKKAAAG